MSWQSSCKDAKKDHDPAFRGGDPDGLPTPSFSSPLGEAEAIFAVDWSGVLGPAAPPPFSQAAGRTTWHPVIAQQHPQSPHVVGVGTLRLA